MRSRNEQPAPPAGGTPSSRPASSTWISTRECKATAGNRTSSPVGGAGSRIPLPYPAALTPSRGVRSPDGRSAKPAVTRWPWCGRGTP